MCSVVNKRSSNFESLKLEPYSFESSKFQEGSDLDIQLVKTRSIKARELIKFLKLRTNRI